MVKKILSEYQKRCDERNSRIRKRYDDLLKTGSNKMVIYELLSQEFEMTSTSIQRIIKSK